MTTPLSAERLEAIRRLASRGLPIVALDPTDVLAIVEQAARVPELEAENEDLANRLDKATDEEGLSRAEHYERRMKAAEARVAQVERELAKAGGGAAAITDRDEWKQVAADWKYRAEKSEKDRARYREALAGLLNVTEHYTTDDTGRTHGIGSEQFPAKDCPECAAWELLNVPAGFNAALAGKGE